MFALHRSHSLGSLSLAWFCHELLWCENPLGSHHCAVSTMKEKRAIGWDQSGRAEFSEFVCCHHWFPHFSFIPNDEMFVCASVQMSMMWLLMMMTTMMMMVICLWFASSLYTPKWIIRPFRLIYMWSPDRRRTTRREEYNTNIKKKQNTIAICTSVCGCRFYSLAAQWWILRVVPNSLCAIVE